MSANTNTPEPTPPIHPCADILASNLASALYLAIESLRESELKQHGPTFRSTFRAGLESNLAAMREGQSLRIQ